MIKSLGLCCTTSTERFVNRKCKCETYPGNLGPCKEHEQGSNGRCVYCDHELSCLPEDLTATEIREYIERHTCSACILKKLHTDEQRKHHPMVGHGYSGQTGWTHPLLAEEMKDVKVTKKELSG